MAWHLDAKRGACPLGAGLAVEDCQERFPAKDERPQTQRSPYKDRSRMRAIDWNLDAAAARANSRYSTMKQLSIAVLFKLSARAMISNLNWPPGAVMDSGIKNSVRVGGKSMANELSPTSTKNW